MSQVSFQNLFKEMWKDAFPFPHWINGLKQEWTFKTCLLPVENWGWTLTDKCVTRSRFFHWKHFFSKVRADSVPSALTLHPLLGPKELSQCRCQGLPRRQIMLGPARMSLWEVRVLEIHQSTSCINEKQLKWSDYIFRLYFLRLNI